MKPVARTMIVVLSVGAGLLPGVWAMPAQAAVTATAPPGWVEVDSAPIPIPPGQAGSGGSISCPPGTVPWSGGAFAFGGGDIGEDINSSAPTDTGWTARYNNRTGRMNETFGLDAICANEPPGYAVVSKTVDNAAQTRSFAIATSPAGTVVLGGGALSSSVSINVELLSAWPQSTHKFKAVMWNGSVGDEQLTTFAVCAQKPPRYSITPAPVTDLGGPSIDLTGSECPPRTTVIGGGLHVSGARQEVTLGRSINGVTTLWDATVLNNESAPATFTSYAICAA